MALDLFQTQRARMIVEYDDGNGSRTNVGTAYHWSLTSPIIDFEVLDGPVIFARALQIGTAILHVWPLGTRSDDEAAVDVDVTVTQDPQFEPGPPRLVVSFGTPEPKPPSA